MANNVVVVQEDVFDDESLSERLEGLLEMIPEAQREKLEVAAQYAGAIAQFAYHIGSRLAWVVATSAIILVGPGYYALIKEEIQNQDAQAHMQQSENRQLLLQGPSQPGGDSQFDLPMPPK